jgi:hypothetical protein
LQPFQLTASRGRIQAEDRGKVGRFPFKPHYSRLEKLLLFFLSDCPPYRARLFEGSYIVSNTCPELRSLQGAAQDAQLGVERRGANFLLCPPGPVIGRVLLLAVAVNSAGVIAAMTGWMRAAVLLLLCGISVAVWSLRFFEPTQQPAKVKGVHASFPEMAGRRKVKVVTDISF